MGGVHYSPYAGSWYPGDAKALRELLANSLENSGRRTGTWLPPDPIAFVVPHAGLMYSGTVAAAAYRSLEQRNPRRVVVLGFSHRGGPAGVAIPLVEVLATPLGEARLDLAAAERLARHPVFSRVEMDSVCDHSVEMQIPWLQHLSRRASILPLYVGRMTALERESAARTLAELAGPETVWLASSDLTHFGRAFGYQPFPADGRAAERLEKLDREVIEDAGSLDPELFLSGLASSGATVCGRAPMALLLSLLRLLETEEIFQETLDYRTSGEITGDYEHSVSYGALGYYPASSFELGKEDCAWLMRRVRDALARFGGTGASPAQFRPALGRRGGVFVTLRQGGSLRGCVGSLSGRDTLADAVDAMAIAAAVNDPRFPPLSPCAARAVEAEISILSPMKRVAARESFRLGEHGALLESQGSRSLLLPQIAVERGWGASAFWEALARKAGFGEDVYENPATRLHVFRTQLIR